ncbi:MAG: GNAT family N-acetyltransferase [Nanoarchaeota archaeon]|nr:GNAT family N-acetyltransferase [Nanoarchaeota archaeon]MBU4283499.1 GNAT family N-acetyltransferase [Nanoarchaeota archaeon]
MVIIKIVQATTKDKNQLFGYFKHYKVKEIIENRIDCYLSHNFTVVAKENDKIVGTLQWHIKEDPKIGLVEFEEIHVLEKYRGKGIGSSLLKFAIQSVNDYFRKIKIKPRKIFLFVDKKNKSARDLYEKYGFKLISEVGDLFSDHEVEFLYSLNL